MSVLDTCVSAENPAKSPPIKAGEVSLSILDEKKISPATNRFLQHVRQQLSKTYVGYGEKTPAERMANVGAIAA